jgi:DNA invertase Pin-like site-specific DNA recombinase
MTLPMNRDKLKGLACARWIRESSKRQLDRFGPPAQRAMQDAAIGRWGLVDTGLAWEVGRSGWSGPDSMKEPPATKTPQFKAMLAAADRGDYHVLLVGYSSRFIRDLALALDYRRQFQNSGVVIYLCDDDILSSDPADWERYVEKARAAEVYSRDQSKNVRSGYTAKRAQERDPGGHAPQGFRRTGDKKLLEPDPQAMAVPTEVFQLSATGVTDREIAERLRLTIDKVRGILKSPLYIGRLRDGGAANWPPVIPIGLWNSVQVVRAARATTAGRPASPRRPYALSGRIRCLGCGRSLIGDTGYYRHNAVCPSFASAIPERPPGWHGRRDGKGYRREEYEAVIGKVLATVSLNAGQVSRVVGMVVQTEPGPDKVALRRIEQERDAALQQVLKDRDYEALRLTMERLDREASAARAPREADGVPAEAAVKYLRGLGRTWRLADGGPGRRQLVEAVFETVGVLGFREMVLRLTPEAVAHGFHEVIPERLDLTVGYGRGERI